jgi:regulator of replication initiation timing
MSELMNMSENKDSHIHRLEEMMPVTVPQFVVNEYNQLKLENIALKARVAELEEKLTRKQ